MPSNTALQKFLRMIAFLASALDWYSVHGALALGAPRTTGAEDDAAALDTFGPEVAALEVPTVGFVLRLDECFFDLVFFDLAKGRGDDGVVVVVGATR